MREHWRRFAREDAMYYVATNQEAWTAADFYSVGKDFVADAVAWAGPGIGRSCAVEIGCGAGRMLVHLASEFDRVEGFDIAPEMIEIARAHVPDNVNTTASSGADLKPLADGTADFVFCAQVFQHIPDAGVVDRYVSETSRVLRPGGRAMLHFDTRHDSLARRAAMALPDFLLPRNRRRYIRRYPLPAAWPAERAAAAGLMVVDDRGRGTVEHMLLAEKPR
jgi:SAM-dependent methyltransferase